jgi:hypothetical protein
MTVRYYISLIFLTLLTLSTSYGQGNKEKNNTLFKIKTVYKQITAYKKYNTVIIDNSEDFLGHITDNGGNLTGYFKKDSLKKIVEWVGLSNKVIQNEYYFNNNKLVFVYSTESRYQFNDRTQSFDYSKLSTIFKRRYYFDKDKLINTIFNDKEHVATREQIASGFLTSGRYHFKLLNTKRK